MKFQLKCLTTLKMAGPNVMTVAGYFLHQVICIICLGVVDGDVVGHSLLLNGVVVVLNGIALKQESC